MIALLLILIPVVTGLATFWIKKDGAAKSFALFASLAVLFIAGIGSVHFNDATAHVNFKGDFLSVLGSSFSLRLNGISQLLCLLTGLSYPLIFAATWNNNYEKPNQFYGLMLLSQAGILGVFLAADALLFYFFWELALIPVYFLCSMWGGEKRIAVTFKFFVYTFLGSVLMLIGILYIYNLTPDKSFAIESFYKVGRANTTNQSWLFWLFFVAFAVKMPVFPFHTWQPDTYQQSPTAVTMVLSGLMVKMGLFGVITWLIPVLPIGSNNWAVSVSFLCVIGIIYASLIAMRQDDIKRLIAYSSIAHIGFMCLAIFSTNEAGMQGAVIQMFNHGVNIIGLWIIAAWIERKFGTRKLSELGGLAQKAPAMAIFFVVIALANIALPLTNAFVGEFLMFNGVFTSNTFDGNYTVFGFMKLNASNFGIIFTVLAGIGIILSAVYTLRMVQKVLYGNTNSITANAVDISWNEKLVLSVIVVAIIMMGIYPQPVFDSIKETVGGILQQIDIGGLIKK